MKQSTLPLLAVALAVTLSACDQKQGPIYTATPQPCPGETYSVSAKRVDGKQVLIYSYASGAIVER